MKKVSKLKRMGVKSVNYNENTILINNSFSKNTELLYSVDYQDIDNLKGIKNINFADETKGVKFQDKANKNGFTLSKRVRGKQQVVDINKVKKVSYAQKVFNVSTANNLEIQIYQNLEDIKKIITTNVNNVLYTINSVYKDVAGDDIDIFDKIGQVKVSVDWYNFCRDNPQKRELWEDVYLPNFIKVLERYGLVTKKSKQTNYIKWLQYVVFKNRKNRYCPELRPNEINIIENLIKDSMVNSYLMDLAFTPVSKFVKEANEIPLFDYKFHNERVKRVVLKKLAEDKILKTCEIPLDTKETAYNYLRLISAIRMFAVHNQQGIKLNKNSFVNDNAKRDVEDFTKRFVKSNYKYFCILHDLYGNENVFDAFYNYTILDDARNIQISAEKIKKYITNQVDITKDVSKEKLSEYQNKFKTLSMFLITSYLKEHEDKLNEIIINLKECGSEDEKEKVYQTCANEFIRIFGEFKDVRQVISKYVGKINNIQKFDFHPKLFLYHKSLFYEYIYVMSKFLTIKECRNLFSNLINKYESILSLLELAEIAGLGINQETFRSHMMLFMTDDVAEINPLHKYNISKILFQLKLLRGIRTRDNTTEDSFQMEIERIYQLFNSTTVSLEDLKKELNCGENGGAVKNKFSLKPLKSYLKNDVFLSKQYQYISAYSSTALCNKIMKNREIIRFVIENMVDASNKDNSPMKTYLARVYHDFLGEQVDVLSKNYLLNKKQIEKLIDEVHAVSLEKLIDTIFNKTNKNYKVLVKLYINICYLLLKNINATNSAYLIQIQDYEKLHWVIYRECDKIVYDLSIVNHFMQNSPNKNCRSYRQLVSLLNQDYIKQYVQKPEYEMLTLKYRNVVAHGSLLNDLEVSDFDFMQIKKVTSYFALYQTLIQARLINRTKRVWGEKFNELFVDGNEKSYSTKLCIAMNMPYAYNISRFNNNTIEKYAIKKNN